KAQRRKNRSRHIESDASNRVAGVSHRGKPRRLSILKIQFREVWAGLPVEPGPHWTERPGTLRLAATSVPSRIGHLNSAEYGANWGAAGVLGRVSPAAVWTSTSLLQLFARLLGDYKILHACQQRFALGQIHAKRFHRQFLPLDRQDLPASFVPGGV